MVSSDVRVRVVVVDDHPFFRDGLIRGLTNSGRVEVVGEAENGRDGLAAIAELKPDVAVVDYQMPDLNGLQVLSAVVRDELTSGALVNELGFSPQAIQGLLDRHLGGEDVGRKLFSLAALERWAHRFA